MPRRVYTYPASMGWAEHEPAGDASGAAVIFVALLVYLINVVVSLRHGAVAGDNPWGASTLEWATSSPPPPYNFSPQPTVASREPLWHPELAPPADRRARIRTSAKCSSRYLLDAEPDHRYTMPGPSLWPFLTAIATSRHVRLVDLPGDRGRLGRDPDLHLPDRLVLADEGQGRPRSTASATAASRCAESLS